MQLEGLVTKDTGCVAAQLAEGVYLWCLCVAPVCLSLPVSLSVPTLTSWCPVAGQTVSTSPLAD